MSPKFDYRNSAVRKIFSLMAPAMFGVSVAQINLLINSRLASYLETGSPSWLYYSDRVMEFPVGVFGIALATVVLPNLSREYQNGTTQSYSQMMDWALRWVVLIAFPATAALIILSPALLTTLYHYNAFTERDVLQTSLALQMFSIGVCGFIFVKILAPGFFARKDTKTPMRIAVVSVLINIGLSLILIRYLAHYGLALAISVAAWANTIMLYWTLRKKGIFEPQQGWLKFLIQVGIAVFSMSWVLNMLLDDTQTWLAFSLLERLGNVAILLCGGLVSYFVALGLLGVRPNQFLLRQDIDREA